MSKIAKFARYDQLEHSIEQIELGLSKPSDHTTARRLRKKLDSCEAELTALHAELYPIAMGSPFEAPSPKSANGCDAPNCDYVFRDANAQWSAGFLCPRHEPDSPGMEPNDPNYRPGDRIVPMHEGGTR